MANRVRMAKSDIGSVISAQACAANCHARNGTFAPREIENITDDDALKRVMRAHTIGRMDLFVVKTLEIDRVGAIDRDFSGIDITGARVGQTKILVLRVTSERSRKKNERNSATVTEDEHLEIAAQVRRVPFDVTFVHFRLFRAKLKPKSRKSLAANTNSRRQR